MDAKNWNAQLSIFLMLLGVKFADYLKDMLGKLPDRMYGLRVTGEDIPAGEFPDPVVVEGRDDQPEIRFGYGPGGECFQFFYYRNPGNNVEVTGLSPRELFEIWQNLPKVLDALTVHLPGIGPKLDEFETLGMHTADLIGELLNTEWVDRESGEIS